MTRRHGQDTFADEIRCLVSGSGVSQHQIARDTGIRQPSLSKFLNGGSLTIETLGVLLEYFDMEMRPKAPNAERVPAFRAARQETPETIEFAGLQGRFATILIDPPWRFQNRTGKVAPEHRRLRRYTTLTAEQIKALPIAEHVTTPAHLYLWCPNALLREGLDVMEAWGFTYKTNIVWYKVRKDGGPDGRGVGFYFRNVTELLLFGVKGSLRTLAPGRRQVNILISRKREHSRKPVDTHDIIMECSPGPYLELFAREQVNGWTCWGEEVDTYEQTRPLYKAYNGTRRSPQERQHLRSRRD
jgi:N6-adenosine-specific RNA methylase IME4/predicted XRE-type DNA-binding protein